MTDDQWSMINHQWSMINAIDQMGNDH